MESQRTINKIIASSVGQITEQEYARVERALQDGFDINAYTRDYVVSYGMIEYPAPRPIWFTIQDPRMALIASPYINVHLRNKDNCTVFAILAQDPRPYVIFPAETTREFLRAGARPDAEDIVNYWQEEIFREFHSMGYDFRNSRSKLTHTVLFKARDLGSFRFFLEEVGVPLTLSRSGYQPTHDLTIRYAGPREEYIELLELLWAHEPELVKGIIPHAYGTEGDYNEMTEQFLKSKNA